MVDIRLLRKGGGDVYNEDQVNEVQAVTKVAPVAVYITLFSFAIRQLVTSAGQYPVMEID
jgi:hypothetical protein